MIDLLSVSSFMLSYRLIDDILREVCYKLLVISHESDHCQPHVLIPSPRNMQLYKQKIAAAKKGHELLKRKADALKKKFKEVMKDLLDSKKKMGE